MSGQALLRMVSASCSSICSNAASDARDADGGALEDRTVIRLAAPQRLRGLGAPDELTYLDARATQHRYLVVRKTLHRRRRELDHADDVTGVYHRERNRAPLGVDLSREHARLPRSSDQLLARRDRFSPARRVACLPPAEALAKGREQLGHRRLQTRRPGDDLAHRGSAVPQSVLAAIGGGVGRLDKQHPLACGAWKLGDEQRDRHFDATSPRRIIAMASASAGRSCGAVTSTTDVRVSSSRSRPRIAASAGLTCMKRPSGPASASPTPADSRVVRSSRSASASSSRRWRVWDAVARARRLIAPTPSATPTRTAPRRIAVARSAA